MPRFGEKRDEGCFVRTRHRTENDAGTKARICHYIFTIKEARNMKKFFALLLAAMMVFVFVSCGDTQGDETTNPSDATETTDTTGPADTTNTTDTTEPTDTTNTTADTETTDTTGTPEPEPEPAELPEAYVDFEFTGGTIADAKGNVAITNNGATVGKATVTVNGETYEVDALQITESGQYVLCEFENLTDAAQVKTWAEGGFAIEAFYVMGDKSGVQGIVCATEQYPRATGTRGGWGIAENAGKPYFITAVSGNAYCSGPTAANATSTTELVHVVAVYDYENKLQHLYINGVAEGTGQAITGEFAPATDDSGVFTQFMLGADAYTGDVLDFPSPDMTMVDAKIYSQVLTAEQVETLYEAAVAALS